MSEEQTPDIVHVFPVAVREVQAQDQTPVEAQEGQEGDPCACTVPMAEWLEVGTEEECRPCLLPPVVQWYNEELKERGLTESVEKLEAAVEEADPAGIAKTLDEIREAAPEEVRTRLLDFDCAAQTFVGDIEELTADEPE